MSKLNKFMLEQGYDESVIKEMTEEQKELVKNTFAYRLYIVKEAMKNAKRALFGIYKIS